MARRNLLDDATSHHFVGDFPPCPVGDGTFRWRFAGECEHLAGLLHRNLRGSPWSRDIAEPLVHGEILERELLPPDPAHAPAARRIRLDSQFSSNLRIIVAL